MGAKPRILPAFAVCLGACIVLTCKVPTGSGDVFPVVTVNGVLMSFLDALRSLAEQVAVVVRLIIEASVLR
jgi:hypothetical protein